MSTMDELNDKVFGPVGTLKRDRHDRNVQRRLFVWSVQHTVTRHWPEWLRVFWVTFFDEGLYGAMDAYAFCYFDDVHVPHFRCKHGKGDA